MPILTSDSKAGHEPGRLIARAPETETGLLTVLIDALDFSTENWVDDTPPISQALRTQLNRLTTDLPTSKDSEWKSNLVEIGTRIAQGRLPMAKGLLAMPGAFVVAKTEQLVDLPAGPFGEIDPRQVDDTLRSSSAPSIRIQQSTAFILRFLDLLAQRIEAAPQESLNAYGKAARLRLFRAALASGLSGSPFVIDVDRLRRDLGSTGSAEATGRVQALKKLYPVLEQLARQGAIGPLHAISNDPATRTGADWQPWVGDWSRTGEAPTQTLMRALMPDLSRLPSPPTAEEVLPGLFSRWKIGNDRWSLSRTQGRLTLSSAVPNGVGTTILFPVATADTVGAQNALLLTLERLLRLTGLAATSPDTWPETLSIDAQAFKAGSLVLASADPTGRWSIDPVAAHHALNALARTQVARRDGPVDHWADHIDLPSTTSQSPSPLPETSSAAGPASRELRLFVALENEETMDWTGRHLLRQYADRGGMVWIRLAADGSWKIRSGEPLLHHIGNDTPARPIQLIVHGHGTMDPRTKQALLAGYRPDVLSGSIGRLLKALKQRHPGVMTEVARTRLLGCALESPVYTERFGATFARSAAAQGWALPDMRTTVYAETMLVSEFPRLGISTILSETNQGVAPQRKAAGKTWQYWIEDGQVRRSDKYPEGGAGEDVPLSDDMIIRLMGDTAGARSASPLAALYAAEKTLWDLDRRATSIALALQEKLVDARPRVATTAETKHRLGVALGRVARNLYGPGLQIRQAASGASASHLDDMSARHLDEAAAHVVTGMFDGSFLPLNDAHRSLLTVFVAGGGDAARVAARALEALTTLKDNVLSLMDGLVDDATAQASKAFAESYIDALRQPAASTSAAAEEPGGDKAVDQAVNKAVHNADNAADNAIDKAVDNAVDATALARSPGAGASNEVGRASVIAHTLDQLTASWPDDASLPSALRSDLRQALDRLSLSNVEAPLASAALRQLATQLFDAILDEGPLQMGRVYAALLEAERQDQGDAGAGARATRSFQGLVDEIGELLAGHPDATAETRTVRGRALAAFFVEALDATGPDRPFVVRLDPLIDAREAGASRALRIDAGLRLAALDRLRLLSDTEVIGPLRFMAASLRTDIKDEGVHWRGVADGGYETSAAGAARLLAGFFFDPVDERVSRLRDDVLIRALSDPWKRFVTSTSTGTGRPGSREAKARARLAGFGQAIVDDLAGLAARPLPERGIVIGEAAWQRRSTAMAALLASLRADPAVTPDLLDACARLERLVNGFLDQSISGWVRQSALGWHALSPVTDTRPLPLLAALAPGMEQHLDRAAGVVELTVNAQDKRSWRVPALGDPADPAMRARQDDALRQMDIWIARDHVSADGQSLGAMPAQVRWVDGMLEIDGVVIARLARIDDDTSTVSSTVSSTPPSDARRPNDASLTNSSPSASGSAGDSESLSASDSPLPSSSDSDSGSNSNSNSNSDSDSDASSDANSDSDSDAVTSSESSSDTALTVRPEPDARPARSRWSPDPAGALTIEQRAAAIAAAFEVDTADWGLSLANADALRERLLPRLRHAASAHARQLPAAALDAGAAPLLDALIGGSPLRLRDAYLALLDAVDPARRRTPELLAQASAHYTALKRLAWDGLRSVNGEYRAETSQTLADLYLMAVDAAPGTALKLVLDEMNFAPLHNRSLAEDAAVGVTLTLYERLRQLDRAGLIGEVLWTSDTPRAGATWRATGTEFLSTDDMRDLRARWVFEPTTGLQERKPLPQPPLAALDDTRPLRTLAAMSPGLRQTLDRQAGTVRLAWTSAGVRGHALLVLPPEAAGSGLPDLDGRLRQLDLLVSAHVARADGADLNALPAELSFTAAALSDGPQVIARSTSSGWRFGQDTPPAPGGARPMPADGAGRVEVITALLQTAMASWPAPDGGTDAEKDALVEAFGLRRFDERMVRGRRTSSMRPVAETLLAGILDASVPTLRRAYDLLCAMKRHQDPAAVHRQASLHLRLLIARADAFLAGQPGDGQAAARSLPGRTLAGFYADLLNSAANGTPLTLDFESMRTALDRGYARDPAATSYCGLVLALRDQLRLMTATGVIGPVRHVATRVPNDDSGAGWVFDGQRWTTQRDMMAEYWPTAVVDPASGKVERLSVKDLVQPWEDFADELNARNWPGRADRLAANRLDNWADTVADELRALGRQPPADRPAGMSAAAWHRRRADAQALRDDIHRDGRLDDTVRDYADRLVAIAQAAAAEAATPARQAAFGRGTMPAVDDAVPLPLLRRIAPDVLQRLDRDAGVVRLSQGGTTAVWRLGAASGRDAAAHRRLDDALRTVDALITRDFARGQPSTLETLPRDLSYTAGEMRSGSGELLARRLDLSPSGPGPDAAGGLGAVPVAQADAGGSPSGGTPATSLLDRPLAQWRNELTARKQASSDWQALKDQVIAPRRAGKHPRMMMQRVVLQMDDSPRAFEASLRQAGRARSQGGVLWLQADRLGRDRIVAGGELIGTTWAGDRIKLVIVGQGSRDRAGQRLSGYDGSALSARVEATLSEHLGRGRPVFGKVTLLACDLQADRPPNRFVQDFVAGFQPSQAYEVTSFQGQVLFPVDDPKSDGLTQRWTLGEGPLRAMRHAADGAFVTRHVPGAPPQAATPKHAQGVPTVLPTAETITALDTALDDGATRAQRLLAAIEQSLAVYDPALDAGPPEVLQALFTDGDGQVDEVRLQRVASDPLEQDQLLQDLRQRLATAEPGQIDDRSLWRWTDESLAGRIVSIRGRDLPASFLNALGARVDGRPLPDRLARGDFRRGEGLPAHTGLTLDAESFQRVLRQLPDEAGAWIRLASLTDWMADERDSASLFHGQHRAGAIAMAERLEQTIFDARNVDSDAIVDLHAAILGDDVGASKAVGPLPRGGDGHAAAPEHGLLDVLHQALAPALPAGAPEPWTPERSRVWTAAREQLFRLLAADWPVVDQPAMRRALTDAGEALLAGRPGHGRNALRAALLLDGQGDGIVDLPAGPFGDIDRLRIDETARSALMPSRSIRRSTRLYLDFLDGMAALIEANPAITSTPWRTAAALRGMRSAMASGLGHTPFLIDVDRVRHDLASSTPAASGRIEALKLSYPALAELSREGTIGPIRFISSDPARRAAAPSWTPLDARWSWSREDQMHRLLPDVPATLAPPTPLAAQPSETLKALFGQRRYLVSPEHGTLWVPHDGPNARRTVIHFAPPPEGSPVRLAEQAQQLRTLARLLQLSGLTADTVDRWPETMWLDPDEFRAGANVLARASADGRWTIHRGTVGRLLASFDHPRLSAATGSFTPATDGTADASHAATMALPGMEDPLSDTTHLISWLAYLNDEASKHDGGDAGASSTVADPVPERGLIRYIHDALTRALSEGVANLAAEGGRGPSAYLRGKMFDELLLRWPMLRNVRLLRRLRQDGEALLDGRFPDAYDTILGSLTGENPQLPLTAGAAESSRTIRASTALYLDFLDSAEKVLVSGLLADPEHHRRATGLRLLREALRSGLKRTPFLIDLDRIEQGLARPTPEGTGHIDAVKQSYRALTELARQGVIGEIRFTSSAVSRRIDPRWTPMHDGLSWSSDDPLQSLLPDLAPLPPAQSAEEALAAVGLDIGIGIGNGNGNGGRSRLDRAEGTLRVASGRAGEPDTVIRFSPLPENAPADVRAAQDRQLLTLARLLRLSGLADTPARTWPTALSIGPDEFKAGSLRVARADGNGRWTIDDTAQRRLLRVVPRARDAASSTLRPASAWKHALPTDDEAAQPGGDLVPAFDPRAVRDPDLLRIYVALQDDRVIDQMGDTLSRKYARGVVLVRLAEDGSWTVRHGRELLSDTLLGKRPVRLILGGHGQVDPATKATRLASYTPEGIATSIGRLLAALRPGVTTKVEGTRILSCALETPTAAGSFGRAFAQAADTAGWAAPGMRTTVYSDLLVHQLSDASSTNGNGNGNGNGNRNGGGGGDNGGGDHFFTRTDQQGQDVRQAAGVTWQFWMENGEVHRQDKYPGGGQGRPIETAGSRFLVGDTIGATKGVTEGAKEGDTKGETESATEGAAARSRQLTGRQLADQARRVRLVLGVLAQLAPDEPPPAFAMHRSDALALSDEVLSLLMARYGLPEDDIERLTLLQAIADDLSQGLLGDATPLRRAYERIGHLTRGEEAVDVSRAWLARANGSPHAQTVLDRIAGSPARIGKSTDLFLKALAAARDSLFHSTRKLRATPSRILGRITLLMGAVGAAASDGALYVDLSPMDVSSGLAGERDIELFRARTALLHLRDLGALRDVVALSIDSPQAAPHAIADGWHALGNLEVRPATADAAATVVAVTVAPLSEPLVAAGFRHLEKFDDHGVLVWGARSAANLEFMTRSLSSPLTEALDRLAALQRNASTPTGRQALDALIDDLHRRVVRIRRHNAPAWTFDTFRQELLATGADRPLHRDALDPESLAPHFQDLPLADSERLSDAMEIHRAALQQLDARVESFGKWMAAKLPGDSAEAADLLPDGRPLAALLDRAPHVRQSMDRVNGLIHLEHPQTQVVTTLSVDPVASYRSDGATERTAMVRQDADIRTAEALVMRLLQASSALPAHLPQALGELPRSMSLRNGEFRVNEQLVARRRDGPLSGRDAFGTAAWAVDPDGVASVLRALRDASAPNRFSSEVNPWERSLESLPTPARPQGPLRKLKLIVQVDGDAHSSIAAWLLTRKQIDSAAWLQMSQPGTLFDRPRIGVLAGEQLLSAMTGSTEVDIQVVGHSGMQLGESQSLSGWRPDVLAQALRNTLFDRPADLMPTLRRVSLVACDLQAPSVGTPFAVDFIKALVRPGWTSRADVTARTGHVHVAELHDPVSGGTRIMKLTERLDAKGTGVLRHRMPADTMRLTLDPITGEVAVVDRYAEPGEPGEAAEADEAGTRPWQRPAKDLRLMFDSVLGGAVPTPLIELFTDADGRVDEDRMRRVASDPVEVRQLADDLARAIEALPEQKRAAVRAHELLAASSAGRAAGGSAPDGAATFGPEGPQDERQLDDLVRRTMAEDRLDLDGVSRTTPDDALRALHGAGLVEVDATGTARLAEPRLEALMASGDDGALMRAGASLLHLSDPLFEELRAGAGPAGQRLLDKALDVRSSLAAGLGDRIEAAAGHGVGQLNTVIATVQLVQGWRHMDATMKGLLVPQTAGVLITPLTVKVGEWIRGLPVSLGLSAESGLASGALDAALSGIGKTLQGGGGDIALASLGLVVIGLQWEEFRKSGQRLDSYAGKSLIANTTTMTFFTATSLVSAGAQVATMLAGGAEAVAGTALGMAAGVLAGAALPLALLMIAVNGAVGSFLWAAEYGDYIRPSTDLGDVIGASVAKFFGIETDVMKRAEVEKNAATAAANHGKLLDKARQDYMAFRGEQLAESGYGSTRYPRLSHEIAHATFRMPKQDPDYTFVLQEQPTPDGLRSFLKDFGAFDRTDPPAPQGQPAPDGVAWIDLRHDGRLGRSATTDPHRPQLFELQGAAGRYRGGAGRDVFLLDADATPDIDGQGGPDEVDLDATGQHVKLHHDAARDRFSLTMDDAEQPEGDPIPLALSNIERVTIRNAIVAEVTGGPGDDRFDVSALQTAIAGGGGRNTYVLRGGNRIASSSDDAAVWSGSVDAFIDFIGDTPGNLLLRVDVPHEALTFQRHGDRLLVGNGAGTLTLERFFAHPTPAQLFIVDAVDTHLTLTDPRRLDASVRPSATLDKHLFLDASTPGSRRALTGDHGHTRHHLAAGGGDFRLRPRTAMPMDITLDVPIDRLRYRRDGHDLVLVETPPADASPAYTPLQVTLPGYSERDWSASHGQLALWARGSSEKDQRSAVKLQHPSPALDADEGPLEAAAPESAASGTVASGTVASGAVADGARARPGAPLASVAHTSTPSTPPIAPTTPTPSVPGATSVDADGQSPRILTGSDGADTYVVGAGREVVIDNLSLVPTRDLLQLDAAPRRLRRVGDDLVIDLEGGSVTVRRHAVESLARHLSMAIGGTRYALPLIHDSGVMVYGPDAEDGDVLATLPGTHVVLTRLDEAWATAPSPRGVFIAPPTAMRRIGRSLVAETAGGASRVILKDLLTPAPRDGSLQVHLVGDEGRTWRPASVVDAPWRAAIDRQRQAGLSEDALRAAAFDAAGIQDAGTMQAVVDLTRDLRDDRAPPERVHAVETVRAYLRLSGLPAAIADAVRSTSVGQLRRMRALLAASVDGKTWPSAALLDDGAAAPSDVPLSAARHGAMLRLLAARQRPWIYQDRVLREDLSPQALDAFETWAAGALTGRPGDAASLDALAEFSRLLLGKPQAGGRVSDHTEALLRLALRTKGRPDDVADQMTDAMLKVTLDEDWIDGMQQAGVVDHAVLRRLWDAKVPVSELVIGNVHRFDYEGTGNRTGLIEVSTSDAFKTPATTVPRYVVTRYLKLDANGNDFIVHDTPQAGVSYDLVPGVVLDDKGQSPAALTDGERSQLERSVRTAFDRKWDRIEDRKPTSYYDSANTFSWLTPKPASQREKHWPAARLAGFSERSSLYALVERKLVTVTQAPAPGSDGYGRSTPSNLVDGDAGWGEAKAWRPPAALGRLSLSRDRDADVAAVRFDFRHPVALSRISMDIQHDFALDPSLAVTGRWRVEALTRQGGWTPVSDTFDVSAGGTLRHVGLDDAIPYRSYRLRGIDGELSAGTWISEVSFETAEVGVPTWRDRFRQAGYDLDRSRALIAMGCRTADGLARASALPAWYRQASLGDLYLAMKRHIVKAGPPHTTLDVPRLGAQLAQAMAAHVAAAGLGAGLGASLGAGGPTPAQQPSALSLIAPPAA